MEFLKHLLRPLLMDLAYLDLEPVQRLAQIPLDKTILIYFSRLVEIVDLFHQAKMRKYEIIIILYVN